MPVMVVVLLIGVVYRLLKAGKRGREGGREGGREKEGDKSRGEEILEGFGFLVIFSFEGGLVGG